MVGGRGRTRGGPRLLVGRGGALGTGKQLLRGPILDVTPRQSSTSKGPRPGRVTRPGVAFGVGRRMAARLIRGDAVRCTGMGPTQGPRSATLSTFFTFLLARTD